MADEQDDPSGLVDMARGIYKKANDFFSRIPTPDYSPDQKSDHDKAVDAVNKQMNDQRVADANKTYQTQTAAQKKAPPAKAGPKPMVKPSPRKR